jgi:5-methylcytosine-specific restriction endonuclease McrA
MIKPENKKFYGKDWKKLSEKIIKERGEICEHCGKKRNNEERYKGWLTVHHKDRNPKNNNPENLIVLCPRCHFYYERLINLGYFNSKQLKFNFNERR